MGTIVERFAAGVGTSNVVTYDPFDPAPIRKAMELVTGMSRLPAVDFANANYLLSFNANLFETFLSPVRNIYSYGQMRQAVEPGVVRVGAQPDVDSERVDEVGVDSLGEGGGLAVARIGGHDRGPAVGPQPHLDRPRELRRRRRARARRRHRRLPEGLLRAGR